MSRLCAIGVQWCFLATVVLTVAGVARADFPLPPLATDTVYVSASGSHEIVCYEPGGTYLFRITHDDLRGPRGLAFSSSGELYAAAQLSHRILVFDSEGKYRRQFTGGGLAGPTSIAFGPDGKLYVSSFNTDEVLIFEDEVFQQSFTAEGLNGPNCIAFKLNGDIFVVSQLDSRVYLFGKDLSFVKRFTGGGLRSAMGVAIYEDELYVTGGSSHNVAVFDLEGNFLRNIKDEVIDGPQGIAFDEAGNFSVTSFYTGIVAQFSPQGERLQVYDDVGMQTARSVAFLPLNSKASFIRGDFQRDNAFDVADPISLLFDLFLGHGSRRCPDAGDVNDDGILNVADAVYSLFALFSHGPPPRAPFPQEGADPTEDILGCR